MFGSTPAARVQRTLPADMSGGAKEGAGHPASIRLVCRYNVIGRFYLFVQRAQKATVLPFYSPTMYENLPCSFLCYGSSHSI